MSGGQGEQGVELPGEKELEGQIRHWEREERPGVREKVPGGQSVGRVEETGQNEPAGQRIGAPELQKYEAGQSVQVRERMRWLAVSMMCRVPDALTVTPQGV